MNPDEFNSIPKDKIMIIGDYDKFSEFIIFNAVKKALNRIIKSFSKSRFISVPIVEKYLTKCTKTIKESVCSDLKRYITSPDKEDIQKEDFDLDNEQVEYISEELSGSLGIKRGDIDRVVLSAASDITNNILFNMSNDKLVKLCWDNECDDFVWIERVPGEDEKDEQISKSRKQPKTKRKKKD